MGAHFLLLSSPSDIVFWHSHLFFFIFYCFCRHLWRTAYEHSQMLSAWFYCGESWLGLSSAYFTHSLISFPLSLPCFHALRLSLYPLLSLEGVRRWCCCEAELSTVDSGCSPAACVYMLCFLTTVPKVVGVFMVKAQCGIKNMSSLCRFHVCHDSVLLSFSQSSNSPLGEGFTMTFTWWRLFSYSFHPF